MALRHVEIHNFLKRVRALVFPAARSVCDPTYDKKYLFAATLAPLQQTLECEPNISTSQRWLGVRGADGEHLSSSTALYPPGLAKDCAQAASVCLGGVQRRRFTSHDEVLTPATSFIVPTKINVAKRALVAGGGGMPSCRRRPVQPTSRRF